MNSFPLIRTHHSNERLMSVVFFVALLYILPSWVKNPLETVSFIIVLAIGLLVDVFINFIRFKKPVCAVSAAVTVAILQIMSPNIPLWGRILGVIVALIIGKHIQGGTGKNIFNPAIVGLLFLSLLFKLDFTIFSFSLWLIPALVLSLLFLSVRPFASIGLISGMTLALFFTNNLNFSTFISYGIIFWGLLVITDTVTTTPVPSAGFFDGLIIGFVPLYFTNSIFAFGLGFLVFNLLSFIFGVNSPILKKIIFSMKIKIKPIIDFNKDIKLIDLTDNKKEESINNTVLSKEEILNLIETNDIFGYGGAGFSTIKKIKTVLNSQISDKYFIINGVECDPGLIHDKWLLQNFPQEITKGIKLITQCINFNDVFLAVKETKDLDFSSDLKIYKIPNFYPAGAEKILINNILKKDIPQDKITAEEGILVLNVQTIYQIYEAVYFNRRANTRYLTVCNIKQKKSDVVKVKLGDNIRNIANQIYPNSNSIFTGGGVMQSQVVEDSSFVEKTTNFIAIADFPNYKESPLCSRCSLCVVHCPNKLMVSQIANLIDSGKKEKTIKYNPKKCISCGSCSYICPAGKNLSARIKEAKEFSLLSNEIK
ncbi:MAG: hypothetical protein A2086_11225 [Spirochaetes bacterium GWD1_27_9]|nr:MAG: hypothetical protein A2Z98_03725 [Spirochaetes bacterium GWB1_27_13]OHD23762.1 MAG: hypothetical protein A2Y34_03235 [Spirochaetes bacterium GWC1_27_15]OHD41549.1 MAG: hypothetical protein A2086_11225 [Spirochaetes bacterium GWD1_27_9]